ncbi:MAG TPA: Re/Si-specific NAD(P)(+) transhydrogenase subunit alpha [Polyangia bacterium]|jgi:NAD(P) transhydrogenase subunit alpha|nr:Re/Si-specific NAD(P)(+) transhydrogenase subunit alpha [Polyangia bacterium]
MKVGIPKEIYPNERRVAATPETVQKIRKLGLEVVVEAGAGDASTFADSVYVSAGAVIVPPDQADRLWAESDIILKVRGPMFRPGTTVHEADLMKPGAALISFFWPAQNKELIERMAARKVTVLAMDAVPRITRAQRMDALSAMANIAGYRAVVEAASSFGRFFPGQVTAAGRVKPAQVFVLGAGVAGLAAIAAARAMGAQVRAFDTRAAAREQVESLGAQFVEFKFEEAGEGQGGYAKEMSEAYLAAEQALIAQHAKQSDIIISTALIPGKPAPQLVTSGAVVSMAHGSVIVDMAAEQGGNCPLTEKDKIVEKFGVTIIGLTDLPSRMAHQASDLYATVVFNLLKDVCPDDKGLALNLEDEIHRGVLVLKDGALMWPPPKPPAPRAGGPTTPQTQQPKPVHAAVQPSNTASPGMRVGMALVVGLLGTAGILGPPEFLQHLTVFLLACVIGWHVVWNVSPALHTPLMSVTNAISGIILIGGMVVLLGRGTSPAALVLGGVAVLVASINVAGGFLVTQRMLKMFRK